MFQEEVAVKETDNYIQNLEETNDNKENSGQVINSDDIETEAEHVEESSSNVKAASEAAAASPPKSILKRSQKFLDTLKPHSSKFDSGSLKKKINSPINKIKKMADKQFKKVKNSKKVIKKIPISKNDIVLEDETKILKLKESPKSRNRELPSFVVKQDSDDIVEIVDLEESPSETRKRRDEENIAQLSSTVVPDEIIELPIKTNETESQGSQEPTVEEILKEELKNEPPSKKSRNKREHVYEDIENYVSKISSETREKAGSMDPIFQDFMLGNKDINISLKITDDIVMNDPAELTKQMSEEDREDIEETQAKTRLAAKQQLLAPISSIDSASSDEERKAQLSIVAEESEASQSSGGKKKMGDESSIDMDVQSLDDEGSIVSGTAIEEELKEGIPEKFDLSRFKSDSKESKASKEETPKPKEDTPKLQEDDIKEIPVEEISSEDPKPKVEQEKEEDDEFKEDVEVRQETSDTASRISSRWSKMR